MQTNTPILRKTKSASEWSLHPRAPEPPIVRVDEDADPRVNSAPEIRGVHIQDATAECWFPGGTASLFEQYLVHENYAAARGGHKHRDMLEELAQGIDTCLEETHSPEQQQGRILVRHLHFPFA